MTLPTNLSDLRNYLYVRAGWWWASSFVVSATAVVLSAVQLLTTSKGVLSLIAVGAVVVPLTVSWMREIAADFLTKGDKCRRLILFADSLGHDIPASQILEMRSWALGVELHGAPFVQPYYSSMLPAGPQRLADNIAESAFFTQLLAERVSSAFKLVTAVSIAGVIAALILSDLFSDDAQSVVTIAKSIAVFVAFLASGDFALMAVKFSRLSNDAKKALDSGARLRKDPNSTPEEVRTVAEEYGIALLQAPPLPGWLYARYRDEMNRMYREANAKEVYLEGAE